MRMKFISMNRLETGTLVYSEKRTGEETHTDTYGVESHSSSI